METFVQMQALTDWHRIEAGEGLTFPATGPRRVRLAIMSNGPLELWATCPTADGGEVLVAAQDKGQSSVEFTTLGECVVRFIAQEDVAIFAKGFAPDHRVAARDLPKFTSLEPRSRRNTEVDRMMMLMQHNENMRQRQMADAIAAMQAAAPAPVAPSPAPVTAPPAGGEGEGGDGAA